MRKPFILVGLAALVSACGGSEQAAPPPKPEVTVAAPLKRDVVDWDEYTGRFTAIEDVELRPRVSGTITAVLFKDGQDVRRGQPLFRIDARPYQALLAEATASVARADATLINARTELKRAQSLLDAQAVSREEYETKLAAVRTSEAALKAARATEAARRLDVGFATVDSPINGRASDRRVSVGNVVAAGETVLTRIVSVDPIWFSFDGAESFYLKYMRQDRAGERGSSRYAQNPIEISLSDENDYRWRGRVDFLDNSIDPSSGTIRAHAVVRNPDRFLTPGMFGRARLLGSGTYAALLVPAEAIVTDQARKLAYVVGKDGKVVPRPVDVGPLVEGLRVVRQGLEPNDMVIIDGLSRVRPGMEVKPHKGSIKPRALDDAPSSAVSTPPSAQATVR